MQAFVNGDNLIGKSSITDVTSGQRINRGLQIGDRVGGGRYAGNGTIVFGDQKTFDTAVAQNQKRLRGVT